MKRRARAAAAFGGGAMTPAAAALEATDRRAIRRDPEYRVLFEEPLSGRARTVTASDGTRLHVEVFGPEDAPTIVFVHGWTCVHEFWTYQLLALRDRYRIVTYDLRGHGRSEAPRGTDFSIQALADDLHTVLTETVPGRALIVGHSLGAMTAVAWAGRHPEAVASKAAGAVLVNTGVGDLISASLVVPLPESLKNVKTLGGRIFLGASAPLPPGGPVSRRIVRHVAMSPKATPAQVAFSERMVLRCRRDVRAGCGRTMSTLALYDSLAHLTVPTVVISGTVDRLTPAVHADRLAEQLPALDELVPLDGIGHMAPLEAHAAVTAIIESRAARLLEREPVAA